MAQEKLQQAATLFKAGDRKRAGELLMEVVKTDPDNADAWYGLAACTDDSEKKKFYLKKVLEINPQHARASHLLEKLAPAKDIAQTIANVKTSSSAINLATPFIVGILVLCVVWMFYKVNRLEKSLTATQKDLVATQTKLTNVQLDLSAIRSSLASTIDTLSYVEALAENANRYAHSHDNFSDIRLKTRISPINDPLSGILSLNGIAFLWDTKKYANLGLSDDPQIGLIAQEVEQIFPELVANGENGFKMVDYEKLIPVLVEAIKQQQLIIDDLELRITTLEHQNR
jgi:tetratricopeptide (TPR) repeat protein